MTLDQPTLDAVADELRSHLRDPSTLDGVDLQRQIGWHEAIETVVGMMGHRATTQERTPDPPDGYTAEGRAFWL